MTGLIQEIQMACLDRDMPVEALLRRLKLAAAKLNLGELEAWVDDELNGYPTGDVPEHRRLFGMGVAQTRFRGWVPMHSEDELLQEIFTCAKVTQNIGSLGDLLSSMKTDTCLFPLPTGIVSTLNDAFGFNAAQMAVQIPRGSIIGLLDHVRHKVLDWAIEMERSGVTGDGMSFTPKEVRSAQTAMTKYEINNYGQMAGNFGSGNSSGDISLSGSNVAKVRETMEQVRDAAPQLVGLGASENLAETVDAVLAETAKSKPEPQRLRVLIEGVRAALAGAAGNILASGVITAVTELLPLVT